MGKATSLGIVGLLFVLAAYGLLAGDTDAIRLSLGLTVCLGFGYYISVNSGYEFSKGCLRFKQGFVTSWHVDLQDVVRAVQKPRSRSLPKGVFVVIEARGKTKLLVVSSASEFLE